MLVEIIKGVYGHKEGNFIRPVCMGEKVALPDKEAERLLHIRVARKVEQTEKEARTGTLEKTEDDKEAKAACEELGNMSFNELKELAERLGIEGISKLRSKGQFIEVIRNFQNDDPPPDLDAEDPE